MQRRKIRTRKLELGAACAAVFLLSSCGGGARQAPPPSLPRPLAQSLADRSDAVAAALRAGDACRAARLARTLRGATIAAINRRQVAPAFQEPLLAAVNDLAGRVTCVRPVPTPTAAPPEEEHGRGKHKGHDKKKHEDDD